MQKNPIILLLVLIIASRWYISGAASETLQNKEQKSFSVSIYESREEMPGYIPDCEQEVTLDLFLAAKEENAPSSGIILILPAGSYDHLSVNLEGTQVAEALNQKGFDCAVLHYRVKPYAHEAILCDAVRAVQYLRYWDEKYKIDPEKIAVMGFSAGGHLALMETAYWREIKTGMDVVSEQNGGPDLLILCYPVVSFEDELTHAKSRRNFLGIDKQETPNPNDIERFSAQKHITSDFPPAFIWHCLGDEIVNYRNSVLLADAFRKESIDCQLTLYEGGEHGLGLAENDEKISGWLQDCCQWLDDHW